MARVTVEDCVEKIPNRYELVVMAARRAKNIAAGAPLTLSRDNDKDAVVSLREIADGTIELAQLGEEVIQGFQRRQMVESLAKIGGRRVNEEGDPRKREIQSAFAEGQALGGEDAQISEKNMDKSGMSFEGENVQVED